MADESLKVTIVIMDTENRLQSVNKLFKSKYFVLALYLIFNILIILFSNVKYEVSDDFMMEMVASGTYGDPDSHIMFSNTIYGEILHLLYGLMPSVSWYYYLQTLTSLLGGCTIVWLITDKVEDILHRVVYCMLFTIFTSFDLFILPQFTKTATLAIIGGGCLFIDGLKDGISWKKVVLGFLLGTIGTLIRYSALYISGPFIMLYFYSTIHNECGLSLRELLLKKVIPLLTVFLILFGLHLVNTETYKSEDYSYFKNFSDTRAEIVDYPLPVYEDIKNELDSIDLSENDYSMIRNWMFDDKKVFSLEKMLKLRDIVNEYRNNDRMRLKSIFGRIYKRGQILYPIAIVCMVFGVICFFTNPSKLYVPILCVFLLGGFFMYFTAKGRTVYRIEFSYYVSALVIIILQCRSNSLHQKAFGIFLAVAILMTVPVWSFYITDNKVDVMSQEEYTEYIDETFYYSWDYDSYKYSKNVLCGKIRPSFLENVRENKDKIYIMEFPTCIQTFYYDFETEDSSSSIFPKNVVYLGGVTTYHPVMEAYCRQLGYNSWLEGLLEEDVYFVGNKMNEQLLKYFREHGTPEAQIRQVGEIDNYKIWKYYIP